MAEFRCFECGNTVVTGEKFTFTKEGAIHFSCLVSKKSRSIKKENYAKLRVLTILMDSELQHLLNILNIKDVPQEMADKIRVKYKDIEKAVNETTQLLNSL
ncbi:MAG: DUF2175 family protein [Candidatus Thermoplasmatota archaeon]|jgi:hypothetical protein|nr:DUF2175 family protein [Candidatus Thermoplasmatota archaeon]